MSGALAELPYKDLFFFVGEFGTCRALEECISAVFTPNLRELMVLLEAASRNEELAFELIQNVREPVVRERFQALAIQRLHNYVAGAMTLVDHVRRLMRGKTGKITREFQARKAGLLKYPEIPFVQDLRNYMLHRTLPTLGHHLGISKVNESDQTMESEVELGVQALLGWDGWSQASREFLIAQGEAVKLRPVIRKHGELILSLNSWLHNELTSAIDLEALNELVLQRNTILVGGDRATAIRLTNERTQRTQRTKPKSPGPETS